MGRPVRITLDPEAMPHICICCKAHTQLRDWFIDTGTEVEWEGYLYICNACFTDMVRVTSEFMTVESHQEVVAMYKKEMENFAILKQRLATFDEAWFDLTGNTLSSWMDNLIRIKEHERGQLQGTPSTGNGNDSGAIEHGLKSDSTDSSIVESEPAVNAGLISIEI